MKSKSAGQKSRDLQDYLGGLGRAEQHIGIAIRWVSYLIQLEKTEAKKELEIPSVEEIQKILLSLRLSMGRLSKAKFMELEDMADQRAKERREATLQSMKPKIGRKPLNKRINTSLLSKKNGGKGNLPVNGTSEATANLPNTNIEEVSNG